jgi:hypothetical protein
MWLFELYVFSDKYDARRFRIQVWKMFDFKINMEFPRTYPLPGVAATSYAAANLPAHSPLRKSLVTIWAKSFELEKIGDEENQVNALLEMPPAFLAECFISLKQVGVSCIHSYKDCKEHCSYDKDGEWTSAQGTCYYSEGGSGGVEDDGNDLEEQAEREYQRQQFLEIWGNFQLGVLP